MNLGHSTSWRCSTKRLGQSSIVASAGANYHLVKSRSMVAVSVDNLWTTLQSRARLIHKIDIRLTRSVRFMLSREPVCRCSSQRVVKLMGALCLLLGSSAIWVQPVEASQKNPEYLKLYAHSIIMNEKQYLCFSKIIFKESRWDHQAKNGSHFGLGQMRSEHYRTLDPFAQLRATYAYITKRYGTSCKAWAFHQKKGHY